MLKPLYVQFIGSWGWLDTIDKELGDFEVVLGDVRDPFCVRDAMRGCDVVIT